MYELSYESFSVELNRFSVAMGRMDATRRRVQLAVVEAAGTWGRSRGVARGLVVVLLEPLGTCLAEMLTQLK